VVRSSRRTKALIGIAMIAAMTGLGLTAAAPAQASSSGCTALNDIVHNGLSACIIITGSGLYTTSIDGQYNNTLPDKTAMQLYINGKLVEKWNFNAGEITHTFKTGYHHTWPKTTTAMVCIEGVPAWGQLCSPTKKIFK
jgi:hypothetical protein